MEARSSAPNAYNLTPFLSFYCPPSTTLVSLISHTTVTMKLIQTFSLLLPFVAPALGQGQQGNPGVVVYNNCPFVVAYYGDGAGTPADSNGLVYPKTAMWNPYNGTGRALKFWKQGDKPIGLLVWGYSADSPFVW